METQRNRFETFVWNPETSLGILSLGSVALFRERHPQLVILVKRSMVRSSFEMSRMDPSCSRNNFFFSTPLGQSFCRTRAENTVILIAYDSSVVLKQKRSPILA
jgi:hypothetical protein